MKTSKIQKAEKTLGYATAALAMGQIVGAPMPVIAKLAFGVQSALERVESLTVTATGEVIQ